MYRRALEEGDIFIMSINRIVIIEIMSPLRGFIELCRLVPTSCAVGYWYVAPPALSFIYQHNVC